MRLTLFFLLLSTVPAFSQEVIPFDTTHWEMHTQAHVFERYEGVDAVYIQQGFAVLKDSTFLNGTLEFDMYLTERQSFPGVRFRVVDDKNMESFFVRPHLSGKPDANQAAPVVNGITAWQLYFGPSYSFSYAYNFDGWTHVKMVINGSKGQVYLDYNEEPHLSWNLVLPPQEGAICIGGSYAPVHYANFKMNKTETKLHNFDVVERKPLEGLVSTWQLSDKFEESSLDDVVQLNELIASRTWNDKVEVEEGTAANISRKVVRYDGKPGNTVMAKVTLNSDRDQTKLFEFGYSDRVVVILNGKPLYKGTNKWRSRDYRYLGTVGLFDATYLNLKKGENTLILAVSEDFGGWLVTGKLTDLEGVTVR